MRLYETSSLKTVRWFFVKADSECTVNAIPEDTYTLVYTSGLDWIDSEDGFRWNPSYHQFERSVTYSEHADEDGVQYHEISVTLHPVVGGNVRTKAISREDFLKGHLHMPHGSASQVKQDQQARPDPRPTHYNSLPTGTR